MGDARVPAMHKGGAIDAKVRTEKMARGASFRDAALKSAVTAYFKARPEIGSRGEFYGSVVRRFAELT